MDSSKPFILFVWLVAGFSCTPLESPQVSFISEQFNSISENTGAAVNSQSFSLKNAVEAHLGVKFWEALYKNGIEQVKQGRELTAENCEACALEEAKDRVTAAKESEALSEQLKQDIKLLEKAQKEDKAEPSETEIESKQQEKAFNFVTKLLQTLVSPFGDLVKKVVKKEGVMKEFANLQELLRTTTKNNQLNGVNILRDSDYAREIGQFGVAACQQTNPEEAPAILPIPKTTYHTVRSFCHENQKAIKLIGSLEQFQ